MTALYVSPHLDDVVFSCAGSLLSRAAKGERIAVCTVFSSGTPETRYASRRAEDAAVLNALGAEAVHLGFLDAPARTGKRPSFDALVFEADVMPELANAVATAIQRVADRIEAHEVWLPLAVGGHVDHRTVHETHAALGGTVRFYEERPYAFVPALRRLRELELCGGALAAPPSARAIRGNFRDGGCLSLLADRNATASELARRLAATRTPTGIVLHETIATFDTPLLERAADLIEGYASETGWLFGSAPAHMLWTRLASAPSGGWFEREVRLVREP
jgi:LmbE family N-acetylglucosaminyl deacetylase